MGALEFMDQKRLQGATVRPREDGQAIRFEVPGIGTRDVSEMEVIFDSGRLAINLALRPTVNSEPANGETRQAFTLVEGALARFSAPGLDGAEQKFVIEGPAEMTVGTPEFEPAVPNRV